MEKMKKFLVLAVMAMLAVSCLAGCGSKKIDVMYDLNVVFTGIDGEGRADIDFENSELGFVEALVVSGDEKLESFGDMARLDAIARTVDFDIEPSRDLSNGDKVTVTAAVDSKKLKELGYSAKTTSKTFKVEGLEIPVEIDPFENYDVTFSGTAPNARVEFETSREVDGVQVFYSCEGNGKFRLGDTATIRASVHDPKRYILTEETREFTVENVDTYVAHAADIPEAFWEDMKAQAAAFWEEHRSFKGNDNWEYRGFDYVGYDFYAPPEGVHVGPTNSCHLVFRVTADDGEGEFSYYFNYNFVNLLLHTDGSWEMKLDGLMPYPSSSARFRHNDRSAAGFTTAQEASEDISKFFGGDEKPETDLPR